MKYMGPSYEAFAKAKAKATHEKFFPPVKSFVRGITSEKLDAERERQAERDAILEQYSWSDVTSAQKSQPAIEIVKVVAAKHGVTVAQINGSRRYKKIVLAKQEAYYQVQRCKGWSLHRLGSYFNKDHTTILHGISAHMARIGAA